MFREFEPTFYFDTLEKQIQKIEDSGEKIRQIYLGRSVWEFIVEDLEKIHWDRAKKLRMRILKLM